MLIIRFARIGRKKQAFFKLVVAEKARAVQKKSVAELGYYNPHTDGGKGEFVYDKEKVLHYIKNGAQMSQTVARRLVQEGLKEAGKFVVARATKPKKEPKPEQPKEEAPAEEAGEVTEGAETAGESAPEENKTEEGSTEEAPAPKEEAPAEEKAEEAPAEETKEEAAPEEEKKDEEKTA